MGQSLVGRILADLANLFLLLLFIRAIVDTVVQLSRTFRPTGAAAAFFEFVFTVTDPPLKALRRIIPPLRIGNAAIDLAFLVLFLGIVIIRSTVFSQI